MADKVIRVCARRSGGSGIWLARMGDQAREINLNTGEVGLPVNAASLEGQYQWSAAKPSAEMMAKMKSLTEAFDLAVLEGLEQEAEEVSTEKPSKDADTSDPNTLGNKIGPASTTSGPDNDADDAEVVTTEKPAKDADESDPNTLGNAIGKVDLSGIASCPKCAGAVLLSRDGETSVGACVSCGTAISLSTTPMPVARLACPNCKALSLSSTLPAGQLTQRCINCGGTISRSAVVPKAEEVATEEPDNASTQNPNTYGAKIGTATCPKCANAVTLRVDGMGAKGTCVHCSSTVSLAAKAGAAPGNKCPMCGGEMDLCGKSKAVDAAKKDLPPGLYKKITGKEKPTA